MACCDCVIISGASMADGVINGASFNNNTRELTITATVGGPYTVAFPVDDVVTGVNYDDATNILTLTTLGGATHTTTIITCCPDSTQFLTDGDFADANNPTDAEVQAVMDAGTFGPNTIFEYTNPTGNRYVWIEDVDGTARLVENPSGNYTSWILQVEGVNAATVVNGYTTNFDGENGIDITANTIGTVTTLTINGRLLFSAVAPSGNPPVPDDEPWYHFNTATNDLYAWNPVSMTWVNLTCCPSTTQALANSDFADPNSPTIAEVQTVANAATFGPNTLFQFTSPDLDEFVWIEDVDGTIQLIEGPQYWFINRTGLPALPVGPGDFVAWTGSDGVTIEITDNNSTTDSYQLDIQGRLNFSASDPSGTPAHDDDEVWYHYNTTDNTLWVWNPVSMSWVEQNACCPSTTQVLVDGDFADTDNPTDVEVQVVANAGDFGPNTIFTYTNPNGHYFVWFEDVDGTVQLVESPYGFTVEDHHTTQIDVNGGGQVVPLHRSLVVGAGHVGAGEIGNSAMDSDDSDTGVVTTHHPNAVIAVLDSQASGFLSTAISASGSHSSGSRSVNVSVIDGTTSELLSGAYSSHTPTVTGRRSVAIASSDANVGPGQDAIVAGGDENTASANRSAVLGGGQNTASAANATVIGGSGNTASGLRASVMASLDSEATNERATVISASRASATGERATIIADFESVNNAQASLIAASNTCTDNGDQNNLTASSLSSEQAATVSRATMVSSTLVINPDSRAFVMGHAGSGAASSTNRTVRMLATSGNVDIAGVLNQGVVFPGWAELFPNSEGVEIEPGALIVIDGGGARRAQPGDTSLSVVRAAGSVGVPNDTPFGPVPRWKVDAYGVTVYEKIPDPEFTPQTEADRPMIPIMEPMKEWKPQTEPSEENMIVVDGKKMVSPSWRAQTEDDRPMVQKMIATEVLDAGYTRLLSEYRGQLEKAKEAGNQKAVLELEEMVANEEANPVFVKIPAFEMDKEWKPLKEEDRPMISVPVESDEWKKAMGGLAKKSNMDMRPRSQRTSEYTIAELKGQAPVNVDGTVEPGDYIGVGKAGGTKSAVPTNIKALRLIEDGVMLSLVS